MAYVFHVDLTKFMGFIFFVFVVLKSLYILFIYSGSTCKCYSSGGEGILTCQEIRLYLQVLYIALEEKVFWLVGKSGYT